MLDQAQYSQLDSSTSGNEIYEGFQVSYKPAPIPLRTVAYCVDLAIVYSSLYLLAIIAVVPVVAMLGIASVFDNTEDIGTSGGIILIIGLVIILLLVGLLYHGYFVYQEVKYGTTLGKRIFGLRVVSEDGQKLSFNQCMIRDLMRYIDAVMIFPGLIAMIASDKNRRLGDMMCGTLVVHSKSEENNQHFLYMQQQDYFFWCDKLGAKNVPAPVCRDYLGLAYPIFITGEHHNDMDTTNKQFWLQCVHHFLPEAGSSGLNTYELQQFFAEHCNQQIIANNK